VQLVRVLDNFCTGYRQNLAVWEGHPKFELLEGSITDYATCQQAVAGMDVISHQAALGSVPRSIADPINSNNTNVSGTLNIYTAAKEAGIKRIVYAASSSTYGDSASLPKVEHIIGRPLSPYAVTKFVMELYADVFAKTYNMEFIGLRYFNVFGPHQSPKGAYAAVIPLFMDSVLNHQPPTINGDGSYSRDFTFVDNVVQANIKALTTTNPDAVNQVYNIAFGESTTLIQLFNYIRDIAGSDLAPHFGPNRIGDIPHSLANIDKARTLLGYNPAISVREGLEKALGWYKEHRHYF
ncbi:MAG: NAD-dependent epimerase/dehydratase family protein, partial [Chitinophagaceae bacterium]|nr:NAD-dependent epimerase/dehydratase family protein [Chitinophagaceae bacterium]